MLWRELVTRYKVQPKANVLFKALVGAFDGIAAPLITFGDLSFADDEEQVLHLAPGKTLHKPKTWRIMRIVGKFEVGGVVYRHFVLSLVVSAYIRLTSLHVLVSLVVLLVTTVTRQL
jgi:hypothetical protein